MITETELILRQLGAIRPLPPLYPWEQPLNRIRPYLLQPGLQPRTRRERSNHG